MRIISGKYKGRHIPVQKNFPSRPTTDFAKENLFNFLNNYFDFSETSVLDLFAGTGSMSYEFASRGCPVIDLVENDSKSFSFIERNIQKFNISEINPHMTDAFRFIRNAPGTWDLIFADPPYRNERIAALPGLILDYGLLKPRGWFILEHSGKYNFSDNPHFREKRVYGSVNFSVFAG